MFSGKSERTNWNLYMAWFVEASVSIMLTAGAVKLMVSPPLICHTDGRQVKSFSQETSEDLVLGLRDYDSHRMTHASSSSLFSRYSTPTHGTDNIAKSRTHSHRIHSLSQDSLDASVH